MNKKCEKNICSLVRTWIFGLKLNKLSDLHENHSCKTYIYIDVNYLLLSIDSKCAPLSILIGYILFEIKIKSNQKQIYLIWWNFKDEPKIIGSWKRNRNRGSADLH